jgi:hypothetical protein
MHSQLLRLNNRYRSADESASNFTINIPSQDCESVSRLMLVSASIPRLFTNVNSSNNTLVANGVVYTIPIRQYTSTELALTLESLLPITVVYNTGISRFEFTDSVSIVMTGTLLPFIGFWESSVVINGLLVASGPPALDGPSEIYVESRTLARKSCLDVFENGVTLPVVCVIDASKTPYGYTIQYRNDMSDSWILDYAERQHGISCKSVDITLTDRFGNPLNLPDNCNVDLVFRIWTSVH